MNSINPELQEYIENEIFPIYKNNDEGHQINHIEYVIKRCLEFAKQFDDINLDMCYAMAAFHDIAHYIDKDKHEILSAKIFAEDDKMKDFFTAEQCETIKEAIEDHRASLDREPRNDYGKILSSADRSIDVNKSLKRNHNYSLKHFPEMNLLERIVRSYSYTKNKFGENGYAKTYVQDKDFEEMRKDIQNLIQDKIEFAKRYIEVNGLVEPLREDTFIKDKIFDNNKEFYNNLQRLHQKKYELQIYKKICELDKPFVVEFAGTPRTGKTSIIKNIKDFYRKGNFKIKTIDSGELTTYSYFNKKKDKMTVFDWEILIIDEIYKNLLKEVSLDNDIILLERGLNDRKIWNDFMFLKGDITKEKYELIRKKSYKSPKNLVDILVLTYTDDMTCIKRDYASSLALEKRNFVTIENIEVFNKALKNVKPLLEKNVQKFEFIDTSCIDINTTAIKITETILDSMRAKYVEKINQEFEKQTKKGINLMSKIRTLISYDNEEIRDSIVNSLKSLSFVDIVGVAKNGGDTFNKILELKPDMVFAKFDMDDMNGIDIMRETKKNLEEDIPVFNIFADGLSANEIDTAYDIVGSKLNAMLDANDQEAIVNVLMDYKEFKNI